MLQHLVKQICVSKGHFRLINTHAWNNSAIKCLPSVTTPVPSQPLAAGRVLMVAMSTSVLSKVLNYEQVKALNEDILLIDVREPQELQQTGVLPKSINIPLGNIENAFKNLTAEEFHQQFNTDKPKSDKPIVFSCKAGIRSAEAMKMVESLGYTNTSNYLGGYDDWHEQTKQLLRKQ